MLRLAGSLPIYPARVSSLCYLLLMIGGGLLLALPMSRAKEEPLAAIDCLFTATSAVSVTGLGVVSTRNDFSWFGQLVILTLIQIGGIGIMTLTTFVVFQLRERASLRHQAIVGETLGVKGMTDLGWVLRTVVLGTLVCEGIGAAALFPVFLTRHGVADAAWHAVFHAVSAYCNAGFALQDDSLVAYANSPWCNTVVAGLIVVGGIGFPVQLDLLRAYRDVRRRRRPELQLHTKLTLLGYAIFFAIGFGATAWFEWRGALAHLAPSDRLMAAAFHSVSCRTAGFNTVDLTTMAPASLLVSMILMTIGAGSCSCGGGVKVSTVMVLLGHSLARLRGRRHLNLFRRTISGGLMERALASTMVFLVIAGICLTALLSLPRAGGAYPDDSTFLVDAFEVVSALGTVGLSIGATAELSTTGKLLVIVLMFLGRVGPIVVFSGVSLPRGGRQLEYAHEEPLLG
ncbi:MAG TPA: hypothetical protein DCQ98_08590 [Planctomycetaceae bacterium]|nr:hypothetical protein [Planctomycetaceae bacterium]HRF00721.1 potassium transporter TrkG [Pirellulaceae bacterium]